MRIGFYTWGDPVMGMGHVFRCLTLAREARRRLPDVDMVFEMKTRPEGIAVAAAANMAINTWADDAVPEGPWDVLVVDQLRVTPEEMAALRSRCGRLVSLDDSGPGHWQADVAINTLYRCEASRPESGPTESRWGWEYILIDPAFPAQAQAYDVRDRIGHVFITQGGSDTWGVLSRLVTDLAPWLAHHPEIVLHLHTGPAFQDEASLLRALADLTTPWQRHGRVADLPKLMAGMDVAIAAGGMMTFELMAVGVPCVTVTAEQKELETTAHLAAQDLTVDLGRYSSGLDWAGTLEGLMGPAPRASLSRRGRTTFDGGGAARIMALALAQLPGISP